MQITSLSHQSHNRNRHAPSLTESEISRVDIEGNIGQCSALAEAAERGEVELRALARDGYPGEQLPAHVLPGLKSVGFWNATHSLHWGIDWHKHEGVEIEFMETGHMGFSVEGKDGTLEAGQIAITRPWQVHRYGLPEISAGKIHWFIIDVGVFWPNQKWNWPDWLVLAPEDLRQLSDLLRQNETSVLQADQTMAKSFLEISRAVIKSEAPRKYSRLAICLNDFLYHLLEFLQREVNTLDDTLVHSRRTVEMFLSELRDNPTKLKKDWSVRQLAACCGINQSQFTTYCRQITNHSPADFLRLARLNAGRSYLLNSPEMKVYEIALECGFRSAEYFITSFKKFYGMTPKDFRKTK